MLTPAPPRVSGDDAGRAGFEARGAVRGTSWRLAWLLVACGVLVLVVVASIAVGSRPIPVGTVLDALLAPAAGADGHVVVRSLRGPRTVPGPPAPSPPVRRQRDRGRRSSGAKMIFQS